MTDSNPPSAWRIDVGGATYSRRYSGLDAVLEFSWQDLDLWWILSADNIWRQYERGKLVAVTTPGAALPIALLAELTGVEINPDAVVSVVCEMEMSEIKISFKDRPVAVGRRQSDGRVEWSANWNSNEHHT